MIFCPFSSRAQDSIASALRKKIEVANSDSIRIPLQIKLANHLINFDVDQSEKMTTAVLQKIKDKGYDSDYYKYQQADAYNELGLYAEVRNEFPKALKNYRKSIALFEEINDSIGMAHGYFNLSFINKVPDSAKSRQYLAKATRIFQAKGAEYSYELAHCYMSMGSFYHKYKQKDSAIYFLKKAQTTNDTIDIIYLTNNIIGSIYYKEKQYDKAFAFYQQSIDMAKKFNDHSKIASSHMNQGAIFTENKEYEKAINSIDSAIYYVKLIGGNIKRLENYYYSRHSINERKGDLKNALADYKTSRKYFDSINDNAQVKKLTELELNYQFEKEKEIAALELQSQKSKKRLYFILLFAAILLGLLTVYFLIKDRKQKITLAKKEVALKETEKIKSELALANRENELKKVIIENSITEEVLNKTLDDIKEIITFENERERKMALRSLSVSLLSEKSAQKDTISLQTYVDEVEMEFKILLDQKFPELNAKEKELLYLIKLGLTTNEITKLLNTTLSSVKSKRYRIRKKLAIHPDADIIAHIEQYI